MTLKVCSINQCINLECPILSNQTKCPLEVEMDPYKALEEYRNHERNGTLEDDPEFESIFQRICERNELEQIVLEIQEARHVAGQLFTDEDTHCCKQDKTVSPRATNCRQSTAISGHFIGTVV